MTPEELQKIIDEFTAEQINVRKRNVLLLDSHNTDLNQYEREYMTLKTLRSDTIFEATFEEMNEIYTNFLEDIDYNPLFKTNPTIEIMVRGEMQYIEEWGQDMIIPEDFCFEATCYVNEKAKIFIDQAEKKLLRKHLEKVIFEKVKSDKIKHNRILDCSTIEAFLAEELTWKGLVRQTYGSCDL